jgi:F0F1-type ATP synthase assembly protein I
MDQKFLMKLLAIASNFIFEMLAGLLIGFFIGRYLDQLWDLNLIFTVGLMVLMPLVAIRNFIVRMLRLGAKNDARKDVP